MQCGLCAVVAGLFRRAMCIAGSRRGSGESCYQELATDVVQGRRHSRALAEEHAETELVKASESVAERVRDVVAQAHEVRLREGRKEGLIEDAVLFRSDASRFCPMVGVEFEGGTGALHDRRMSEEHREREGLFEGWFKER